MKNRQRAGLFPFASFSVTARPLPLFNGIEEAIIMRMRCAGLAAILGLMAGACCSGAEETWDLARVEKRIQELQPNAAEKRFDQIAWAPNICEALKLAREHGR